MTQEQPYEVVRVESDFEIRRYPEHVVAQVRVSGSFESAGNTAFRPLVNYISGRNVTGTGLAMTAPVVQEPIANAHLVSFVLPSDINAGNAPIPTDPSVQVHVMPVEYAAVARFSGRWSESSFAQRARELADSVEAAGLEILGPARFARFNPPWTPWFMRRNEVLLPISGPTST